MTFARLGLSAAFAATLSFAAPAAMAEQLTVASFVLPQLNTNSVMFAWLAVELEDRSGGDLTLLVFPADQLGAGPVQQYRHVVEVLLTSPSAARPTPQPFSRAR
jgi:TRAP-type C4-dicarboxylate transport system substrate-binding protein